MQSYITVLFLCHCENTCYDVKKVGLMKYDAVAYQTALQLQCFVQKKDCVNDENLIQNDPNLK